MLNSNLRSAAALLLGTILGASVNTTCQAQQPDLLPTTAAHKGSVPASPEATTSPRRPVTAEELTDARLVFDELQVRLGIASAKLDSQTVARKREMGRVRALLSVADQHILIQSAAVQRLREREQQVRQDVLGIERADENQSDSPGSEILERAQQPVRAAQERLDRLTGLRSRLKQQSEDLQREHLRRLLEAAVAAAAEETNDADILEAELNEQLNRANQTKD